MDAHSYVIDKMLTLVKHSKYSLGKQCPVNFEFFCPFNLCEAQKALQFVSLQISFLDFIIIDSFIKMTNDIRRFSFVIRKRTEAEELVKKMVAFYEKEYTSIQSVSHSNSSILRELIARYYVSTKFHNHLSKQYRLRNLPNYYPKLPEVDRDTIEWLKDTNCKDGALQVLLQDHLEWKIVHASFDSLVIFPDEERVHFPNSDSIDCHDHSSSNISYQSTLIASV